jgi:hypothetical protein
MKEWPEECKVPMISNKVPISKKKENPGTSKKSNGPSTNTRKLIAPKKRGVVQPSRNQGRKILSIRLHIREGNT